MFLFALTNNVGVGPFLVELPLPDSLERVANVIRASERFLWPVIYAISVLALVVVGRGLRPFACCVVVAIAAVLQVIDTGYGWRSLRARFDLNAPTWTTPLTSNFWQVAAIGKKSVRRIPAGNALPQYDVIAYYALTNGLTTDSVYQSRMDQDKLATINAANSATIAAGSYEADTLYILSPELVEMAKRSLKSGDALVSVDGLFIVAPRWLDCQPCMSTPVDVVAVGRSL
jgi:hypothetical protein